jgi:hypothetical protein
MRNFQKLEILVFLALGENGRISIRRAFVQSRSRTRVERFSQKLRRLMKVVESRSVHMRSVGFAGNCGETNLVDHETLKEHGFDQSDESLAKATIRSWIHF